MGVARFNGSILLRLASPYGNQAARVAQIAATPLATNRRGASLAGAPLPKTYVQVAPAVDQ
jgi:hypothetical protein